MSIYGLSSLNLSSLSFGLSKLREHQSEIAKTLERLSTGKRINRASDDPAGLIAATQLNASQLSIERRLTGFERESAFLGSQEGALSVLAELAIDLNALTVQGANTAGNSDTEQGSIADQAQSIITTIDQLHGSQRFLDSPLLTGFSSRDLGSLQVESTDPETGEPIMIEATLADLPGLMETNPEAAQDLADQAASKINLRRGAIGNRLNAIESETVTLQTELTNTAGALSMIQDADIAEESAKLIRAQILEQATISTMLAQRKQIDSMLDLLHGPTKQPPPPLLNPTL